MRQMVNIDPMTVVMQFYRRVDALFRVLTDPDGGPLGIVEHYFWRAEMQARGAPHIHCKLWVKDAPIIGVDSDNDVKKFIGKYITCELPNKDASPDLYKLVTTYQIHSKCTATCFRKKQVAGKWVTFCRFGYPRKPSSEMVLHTVQSVMRNRKLGRKQGVKLYQTIRNDDETRINDYNPAILLMFGSNMDLQYIGEISQTINFYMTSLVEN